MTISMVSTRWTSVRLGAYRRWQGYRVPIRCCTTSNHPPYVFLTVKRISEYTPVMYAKEEVAFGT